ncbi:MAG TPA: zf-HC2 domain-containing protein [Gemmatimonadales bacterium]|nr:zf-HC2 domain-containing protein [Gemmatimonadales bacterium]
MNGTADAITGHPDDGALLRLIDAECDAGERTELEAHLRVCRRCRDRFDGVRGLSEAVSERLRVGDMPVPRRGRSLAPLKAAAVILLVGAAAAGAQPIGRWIARLAAGPSPTVVSPPPSSPSVPSGATRAAHAGVSFVPTGSTLTVVLRAWQRAGTLTLVAGRDSTAAFGVSDGSAPPGVTVLPSGLVIANDSAGSASYRLTLPPEIERVSVRIATAAPRVIARPAGAGPETIGLGGAGQ